MQWKSNRLNDLKAQYTESLSTIYSIDESRQLFFILTEHLFGYDRIRLATDPDIRLSESEMIELHRAVKELLASRPVQYITGNAAFLDMDLRVNDSVLIPRPETEELVQLIVKKERSARLRIIDIGTGSGCIALGIKKYLPQAMVSATDISSEALQVAENNSRALRLDVEFIKMDILKPDDYRDFPLYDVVVSNPPYVLQSDKNRMRDNVVKYEPPSALFVDDNDALVFYKAILDFCANHLTVNGRVYFEINEKKGTEVVRLLNLYGYEEVKLHRDIHGKDRFVEGLRRG